MGGAFDPPHGEHINLARAALLEFNLERVILMPTAESPHKSNSAPFKARAEMLAAACEGVEGLTVSVLEEKQPAPNYTYAAIPKWRKEFGDFYLLIGGDSMKDLKKWKNPQEILTSTPILVAARQGSDEAYLEAEKYRQEYGAKIDFLEYKPAGVSSTQLKTYIRLYNKKPQNMLEKVYLLVVKHNLYREFDRYILKLKEELSNEKFTHSLSVAEYAVKLNKSLGLPYEDVLLAGLLHDCKKNIRCYREFIDPYAQNTSVEHQFAGAIAAEREYSITSKSVIEAIKCHCTGKPNMSALDKLIYVADKLEPQRAFFGVEELRKAVEKDFETGFLAVLADQKRIILEKNIKNLYPLSGETYKYYNV
jgi:nicotinate-nucleotide adenylyltransferase